MANVIRIKRRVSGATGAPASLENAELAFNEVDNTLYYGKGTGGAGGTATTVEAVAGSGAFATLTSNQTISGNKTFTGNVLIPTVTSADSSTAAASTAFVKAQGYLTSNQSITVSGDATGTGATAVTLTLANSGVTAGTYAKVTVDSKGRVTLGSSLIASDIPTLTASKISDFDTQVRTSRLDQLTAPTVAVAFNAQRITGLADPQAAQDAATKAYVDATRQGLAVKDAVRATTTANVTLSGTQTVDGVALAAGNRVLVKDQTAAAENGLYVVAAGAWTRAEDADAGTELAGGDFVFVQEGTTQADTGWVCTTDGTVTLGTTALNFTQFSGAGNVLAGTGLTKTGNTISISLVPVANGGTGATTLTGILKGNGTAAFTAAVAGTDYLSPSSIIDGGTY